ncbi:MAG TPA: hypothetical protein VNB24_09060 [Acidimicrobiales bacterium]|nr:hypothetical protein [Acidimicrobiales bacterium]
MAKQVIQIYRIWVSRAYSKSGETFNVGNIDGSGVDLLELAEEALDKNPARRVGDNYTRFGSSTLKGRTLRIVASAGRGGAKGDIVHMPTGKRRGGINEDEAALADVRALLAVPTAGTSAFLVCERYAGRSARKVLIRILGDAFRDTFGEDKLNLKHEAVVEAEVWDDIAEQGEFETLAAVRYVTRKDKADAPRKVAVIRAQRKGYRGRPLSKTLLRQALRREKPPGELIGLDDPMTDAEVQVTVRTALGQRTFAVSRQAHPRVSEMLAADDAARPKDGAVFKKSSDLIARVAARHQVEFPPDWRG